MIYAHPNRCGYLYDIFNRVASIGKLIFYIDNKILYN